MLALVFVEVYHGETYPYVPVWLLEMNDLGEIWVCSSVSGGLRTIMVDLEVSSHKVC